MKTYFRKMYNALIILALLVSAKACQKSSEGDPSGSIAGKWQLVEQKVSIGGPAKWTKVKKGETFTFNVNGNWENPDHASCSKGMYEVSEDELKLSYDCGEGIDDFTYAIVVRTGNTFTLTPKSVICTEECLYRYKRK